jgi:hydrogenase nickel incorporation protein HypA/HybF
MHELSIAMSIVDFARDEAEQRGVRVTGVRVRIGALSGVAPEALYSSYEMACFETPLAGSRLYLEEVPVVVFCPNCQARRPLSSIQLFSCGVCGAPTSEVVQGKELEVVGLEIEG